MNLLDFSLCFCNDHSINSITISCTRKALSASITVCIELLWGHRRDRGNKWNRLD